jgi:hypothetical protein
MSKPSEKVRIARNARRREEYKKRAGVTIGQKKNCQWCQVKFVKKNSQQAYCSRTCYIRAKSKRQHFENNKRRTIGGKYAWRHIRDRCSNSQHPSYHLWGGRGVQCKFKDYEDFCVAYFKKDNCQWCNVKLTDEKKNQPNGRTMHRIVDRAHYDHKNVILICRKCHNEHHSRQGGGR